MASFYLDSSALTKYYVTEKGSKWVKSLFARRNVLIISRITHPEVVSALARRVREGTLSPGDRNKTLRLFNYHLRNRFWILEVDAAACGDAALLFSKYPLRAYDSIQLATALKMNQRALNIGAIGLTFLSSDTRLLSVASAEGLAVDNPENH